MRAHDIRSCKARVASRMRITRGATDLVHAPGEPQPFGLRASSANGESWSCRRSRLCCIFGSARRLSKAEKGAAFEQRPDRERTRQSLRVEVPSTFAQRKEIAITRQIPANSLRRGMKLDRGPIRYQAATSGFSLTARMICDREQRR
jgi:hypothetical protein